jgi:hypothetical protein
MRTGLLGMADALLHTIEGTRREYRANADLAGVQLDALTKLIEDLAADGEGGDGKEEMVADGTRRVEILRACIRTMLIQLGSDD